MKTLVCDVKILDQPGLDFVSTIAELRALFLPHNQYRDIRIRMVQKGGKGPKAEYYRNHPVPGCGPVDIDWQAFIEFDSEECALSAILMEQWSIVNYMAITIKWAQSPRTCGKCYAKRVRHRFIEIKKD